MNSSVTEVSGAKKPEKYICSMKNFMRSMKISCLKSVLILIRLMNLSVKGENCEQFYII